MDTSVAYLGEQTFWGLLGRGSVCLALGCAMAAFLFYWKAESWPGLKRWGRWAFGVHVLAILSVVAVVLYLMLNHRFEYYYVWQHSNRSMSPRFIFSALWEGQEGSFLLWMTWHGVLGILVMVLSGRFESRIMWVLSLVQVFLVTMILGIQFVVDGDKQVILGSDFFTLTREHPAMRNVPLFLQSDYLHRLDGRGLNPLLQNYWMTIHPPVLFLGFAATVLPYAWVVGSLRQGDWVSWVKPVLPWAFGALGLLGAGLLMGAAWAYEALSFGGFWAWDPVENASLVPWLALAAGAHLLLLPRLQGLNHFLAVLFLTLAFILVLWSTFLTRSGILGNSSVHSFTDLGMSGQLLLYVGFFSVLPGILVLKRREWRATVTLAVLLIGVWLALKGENAVVRGIILVAAFIFLIMTFWSATRQIRGWQSAEPLLSREIWMFTGSLVLTLSWFQIIHETSRPAFGKAFKNLSFLGQWYPADYAPPSDIIDKYNYVQGLLAGAILLLMGVTQFLRYRHTPWPTFAGHFAATALAAFIPTVLVSAFLPLHGRWHYLPLLYLAFFCLVGNGLYLWRVARWRLKDSAASLAHMGFGLLLAGAVVAGGYKTVVSSNPSEILNLEALSRDFKNTQNLLLHKGDTVRLHRYNVVYFRDSVRAPRVFFGLQFLDDRNRTLFTLWPQIQTNPRMGDVAEPSTRHTLWSDLYTHVAYVDKAKLKHLLQPDSSGSVGLRELGTYRMRDGDTVHTTNALAVFLGLRSKTPLTLAQTPDVLEIEARFLVLDRKKNPSLVTPVIRIENNRFQSFAARCELTGLRFEVAQILPQEKSIELRLSEPVLNPADDFIILQAILFPGINMLWGGAILMTLGILLAAVRRFLSLRQVP
ncbi:MAG: cytochrome c biogenesis protein CcsA [Flavobacteriales bacterium]|nr:cytochrome c biogenesis protein CcsA [Flavobacteriales bacterium]